jgi:hypothetical protein
MLSKIKSDKLHKLYMELCKYTIMFKANPDDIEDAQMRLFEGVLQEEIQRRGLCLGL